MINKLQDITFYLYAICIAVISYQYFIENKPISKFFIGYLLFSSVLSMYQRQQLSTKLMSLEGAKK